MSQEKAPGEALPFGKPSKSFDVTGFIKRYGLSVLVIGAFLFALSVPVVLLISKPNYEVHALMRIDPVIPSVITKSEDPSIINYYSDYANTQARRIMDFETLKATVEKLKPDQKAAILPANLPSDKSAEIIGNIVKVSPVPGTHLVDITISGPKKKGLAPFVNNLMLVYLNKVRKSNEMQDNERLVYLRNEKKALSDDIASIEEQLDKLTRDISTADFSENNNMANKKTEELQKIAVNAFAGRITAENQYKEAERNSQELKKLNLDPMVEEMVMGDQSLHFTSSWTYQQQQQLRSTTDGLTPNNPDRIYVEERMKAMRDYEKKLQNEVRKSAKQIVYGKQDYEQKKELIVTKNKAEKSKNAEEELVKELDKVRNESVRVSLGLHLGEALKSTLKHKRDLLDQIDTRMHELELEGKAPLHIAIESFAREPDKPAGSNTKKLMMVFFALSFGFVGIVFVAFEYFDNRIRRPEEIRHALGYPPAKEMPISDPATPFHRILDLTPEAPAAKAIRSLAVRFVHEKQAGRSLVILFSGVERKAGTTSLALNCAQALATLVPRVLLLEASPNEPALASLAGTDAQAQGVTELLRFGKTPDELIVRNTSGMPDLLLYGRTPGHDLPQQRIESLTAALRQTYDIVCIDAPPVLESSLTEHFVLHSDIVALIVLGESTLYRNLRAAAETLVRLEVPAIAPILNRNGNAKAISIDKFLENRPAFLDKIDTGTMENFVRNLPSALLIIDSLRKKAGTLANNARSKAGTLLKKKKKAS